MRGDHDRLQQVSGSDSHRQRGPDRSGRVGSEHDGCRGSSAAGQRNGCLRWPPQEAAPRAKPSQPSPPPTLGEAAGRGGRPGDVTGQVCGRVGRLTRRRAGRSGPATTPEEIVGTMAQAEKARVALVAGIRRILHPSQGLNSGNLVQRAPSESLPLRRVGPAVAPKADHRQISGGWVGVSRVRPPWSPLPFFSHRGRVRGRGRAFRAADATGSAQHPPPSREPSQNVNGFFTRSSAQR